MTTYEDAAARLDREWPGWYNEIDLTTLNQGVSEKCVIGQLFGSYDCAPSWVYDFEPYFDGESPNQTTMWREIILVRRSRNQPVKDEIVIDPLLNLKREIASLRGAGYTIPEFSVTPPVESVTI